MLDFIEGVSIASDGDEPSSGTMAIAQRLKL